jgi:ribose transport system permease protein
MRTMRFIGPEQKGPRPAYKFRTTPERGRLDKAAWLRRGSLIVFAAVLFYFSVAAPSFLTFPNISNILGQSAILGVLSFGMTIVMIGGGTNVISGGIDLSLANNLGLCAAAYAVLVQAQFSDLVASLVTILIGLIVGLFNAVAIVWLGILPLLATLTVMNICAGFELVLTQNTVIPATTPFLATLAGNGSLGFSLLPYALLVPSAILILLIQYSPFGLRLYAVGGHREAARAAGLEVDRYIVISYLLSGVCGSLGAILSVALLNGSAGGSGDMLLSVVVTTLLGVIFSRRLVPTIHGTLLSVLFVGTLINGFQLTNVSSYWVNGVEGVLILVVVGATSLVRREASVA